MRKIITAVLVITATATTVVAAPADAHHIPSAPLAGTILPGQALYALGAAAIPELADLSGPVPDASAELFFSPELAKACYISPSTGAYVKATCQSYSGSGSRGFQVIGWAWNGCNTYVKVYGSIGSAPTRSSYIPSSGAGTFLPWPWRIVVSWIVKW
jgi:hypothetical protein